MHDPRRVAPLASQLSALLARNQCSFLHAVPQLVRKTAVLRHSPGCLASVSVFFSPLTLRWSSWLFWIVPLPFECVENPSERWFQENPSSRKPSLTTPSQSPPPHLFHGSTPVSCISLDHLPSYLSTLDYSHVPVLEKAPFARGHTLSYSGKLC